MDLFTNLIVGGVVLLLVIRAIRKIIKNNKQGGCGCGSNDCSKS